MTILARNIFEAGEYNNYLIAGNICNAFALGEVGSTDDFFLVGAEPEEESNYPLLTGNILDSEGNLLFRIVRNVLTLNPGNCSKILGNHIGYEIHDGSGKPIFKISTKFDKLPGDINESFVTTITANFYNKKKQLVFRANSGEPDELIQSTTKSAFGFSGGFGLVQGFNKEEQEFLRVVLATRSSVYQLISGVIENEDIEFDGKMLLNAHLKECNVYIKSGRFAIHGDNSIVKCNIHFDDEAKNIVNLYLTTLPK